MPSNPAVDIRGVSFAYRQRTALREISLTVSPGEVFVFLGPNGGGKTTLFRLLATLIPGQSGEIKVLGFDLGTHVHEVRRRIGVVFQAPSLDKKLTVLENMRHQAALYGVRGELRSRRERELLQQLGIADRAADRVETLSGGLRRRVELAKGLIHHPQLVLLDEPSTGLDPGARADLWRYLLQLRRESGTTIVLTTHLLEEADHADRIAILNQGSLVALDSPAALRATVGGDTIMVRTPQPRELIAGLSERHSLAAHEVGGEVRLEVSEGHLWVPRLFESFPGMIEAVSVGKPTLEDVFIAKTGHRFWQSGAGGTD